MNSLRVHLKTQFKVLPGEKFWRCLKKRHPELTVRSAECCSHKRLANLTEEKVERYFDDLHRLMSELHLSGEDIWNMDETGLQFLHKPGKVVAAKGMRTLHARTSDSKESVTVVACVSASGSAMPPACIVREKTRKAVESFAHYLGPKDSKWTYQERGWMDNSLGVFWFREVFMKHCGPRRPQLLLVDSHSSHEVLELLKLAREERTHIFALPPHTTQALQHLDKVVFMPFKSKYNKACSLFMHDHPTRLVDKSSFPFLLKAAWEVFDDRDLLRKAFSSTGVYPPNRFAINSSLFLPTEFLRAARNGQDPSTTASDSNPLPGPAPSDSNTLPATLDSNPSPTSSDSNPLPEPSPLDSNPLPATLDSNQSPLDSNPLPATLDSNPSPPDSNPFSVTLDSNLHPGQSAPLSPHPYSERDVLSMAFNTNVISEADVEMEAALPPEYQVTGNWTDILEGIFAPPPTYAPSTTSERSIGTHRYLTSDEIIQEKVEKERAKQQKAAVKEDRRLARARARQEKAAARGRGRGGRGRL